MKYTPFLFPLILILAGPMCALAHDAAAHGDAQFGAHDFSAQPPREIMEVLLDGEGIPAAESDAIRTLAARYLSRRSNRPAASGSSTPSTFAHRETQSATRAAAGWQFVTTPFNALDAFADGPFTLTSYTPPAGNGALMAASFGAFKPRVRFFWDSTIFYEESDNMPDNAQMPNLMVGITSWQQQVPLPAAYFASVTNPENSAGSLGSGQPNYWRLPLTPTVATSPILIFTPGSTTNNFQRGAIALASNGIAIFNPANNTGRVSYEIGELDKYGGHCGLADDYHYHIIPTHLSSRFGGPLGDDKPVAWGLDGYPIYGYVEPNGTARQALDSHGGHDIGNGWGYHYHAIGTTTVDATHPYGTPQSPYTMTTFHGTVVNFGGQVDGQPEVGSLRASGTGGYTAQPVAGASITAFKNPVALSTDGSGHLVENVGGTPSQDSFLMRVLISGISYDECWRINRNVNPRTLTITWRLAGATTTTTYTPGNATAIARLAIYGMAGASQVKIPDTSQTLDTTATFGEDADYTLNAQSFTDNGNATVTDNITGLIWQKTDNGESTWDNAIANASAVNTGGYTDWRLPTPSELFSMFNHNNGNPAALNATYFPNNPAGTAEYWWTSDVYGTSTTNVWCANAGGGLGGKPKAETISAGGILRYHARYVRGAKPTNAHNYRNRDGVADVRSGWQNGIPLPNDNTDLQGHGGYSTDLLADKAVELIQTRDPGKPMLMYLAFNAIHAGVSAPQSYIDKYTALGVPAPRRTICAAVDCMDVAMGRVLAALDTAGITNNTLVVFMSDNGGDNSAGELNSPLRGTKGDAYDGGIHTPAGIRWPGHLAAGVTSNQYVWVGDIFPTLCAAVGVTPLNTKAFDGVNLWPSLQSIALAAPDGAARGAALVTGQNAGPVALNIFTDPVNGGGKVFKLLRTPGTPITNQLFNMTDDPYEASDLLLGANAASYSAIVTTLTSSITGIVTESYPPYIGPTGITQTLAAGSTITLYAPFSSYKTLTSVQWRKNGSNIANASPYFQVLNGVTPVAGVYMATLTLTNVTSADAANYDVIVTNAAGNVTSPAGALTVLTAPVLNALPAYSPGTNRTVTWPAVSGATSYTVQIAATADFASPLSSQAVAGMSANFTGLSSGTLYHYRASATNGTVTTSFSNPVSSTQDASNPSIAILAPVTGSSTTRGTVSITGSASDVGSGLTNITVNGVAATTSDAYAHWSATVLLSIGANSFTTIATDAAGNVGTASFNVTRQLSTQNDGLPDAWKTAHGIDPNSNGAVNGPLGDIDRDGLSNLIEYGFNLDPQKSDTIPLAMTTKQNPPVTGPSFVEISYLRRIGALDLVYSVETSDNLSTSAFTPSNFEAVSTTLSGDGVTEIVTVRLTPTIDGMPMKFVRVGVGLTP